MKIYKNDFNTLPMQVEENMKNIELLANYCKEAYKCLLTLATTDVSVAISDTNANADTIDGWLIDLGANLFKITGGDGTNLLLEYFTTFPQGIQGNDGANGQDGQNGQNGKSIRLCVYGYGGGSTVTYSNLVDATDLQVGDLIFYPNNYVGVISALHDDQQYADISNISPIEYDLSEAKDKGIYITTTQPSGDTDLLTTDIINLNSDIDVKPNDVIVYIDSNQEPTSVYCVYSVSGTNLSLIKVGSYAKGEKLYHNIVGVANLNWTAGEYRNLHVVFDLYLPFKFTDANSFVSWINGLSEDTPVFGIGQGWSSGWTTVVTMLKPSGQANRVKFDMMSFNHSNLVTDTNIITTNNLSDQTIIIKN